MGTSRCRIPLWLKIAYTAFMAVLIPIYLKNYGATNFLYLCDIAILMTLIGIWLESPLLLSAPLVGIFWPQMLWVVDFLAEGAVVHWTDYMFRPPWFLRFLSFFHFWLPFFLGYTVWRVGYDKRAFLLWTGITWAVLTVCYVYMPPTSPENDPITGAQLRDPDLPLNINYVFNIASDDEPQQWMDPDSYFALYLAFLVLVVYLPTHLMCQWLLPAPHRGPADRNQDSEH
jgi:hypothetical protein